VINQKPVGFVFFAERALLRLDFARTAHPRPNLHFRASRLAAVWAEKISVGIFCAELRSELPQ
jgi:hypothetical protein